jgi:hypothetical protein
MGEYERRWEQLDLPDAPFGGVRPASWPLHNTPYQPSRQPTIPPPNNGPEDSEGFELVKPGSIAIDLNVSS